MNVVSNTKLSKALWTDRTRWIMVGCTLLAACAGGQTAAVPDVAPEVAAPLPGENFLIYFADERGIHRRDTRTGLDRVVLDGVEVVEARGTPGGGTFAVTYRTSDSTGLVAIDAETGESTTVHRDAADAVYTFAWARDGSRLGVGVRRASGGRGANSMLVLDAGGRVRNMGCNASNQFVAFRSASQAMVTDGANFYAVRTSDCGTLTTFPMSGKTELTYSRDGRRVSFKRRSRTGSGMELWIANHDGSNAQTIAPPRYRAQNMQWAPDASKIAFLLQSQQYANVTHLAIHDVATGRATFDADEKPLGMPNDRNPCWSPDGSRIAHERYYARAGGAGQTYTTKQTVVRVVATGEERVVSEELTRATESPASTLNGCGWIDDNHLVVGSTDWWRVVNVSDNSYLELEPGTTLLFVEVFPAAR